jgi:hypothetical protein
MKLSDNGQAEKIIAGAYRVHNAIGDGFLEKIRAKVKGIEAIARNCSTPLEEYSYANRQNKLFAIAIYVEV